MRTMDKCPEYRGVHIYSMQLLKQGYSVCSDKGKPFFSFAQVLQGLVVFSFKEGAWHEQMVRSHDACYVGPFHPMMHH